MSEPVKTSNLQIFLKQRLAPKKWAEIKNGKQLAGILADGMLTDKELVALGVKLSSLDKTAAGIDGEVGITDAEAKTLKESVVAYAKRYFKGDTKTAWRYYLVCKDGTFGSIDTDRRDKVAVDVQRESKLTKDSKYEDILVHAEAHYDSKTVENLKKHLKALEVKEKGELGQDNLKKAFLFLTDHCIEASKAQGSAKSFQTEDKGFGLAKTYDQGFSKEYSLPNVRGFFELLKSNDIKPTDKTVLAKKPETLSKPPEIIIEEIPVNANPVPEPGSVDSTSKKGKPSPELVSIPPPRTSNKGFSFTIPAGTEWKETPVRAAKREKRKIKGPKDYKPSFEYKPERHRPQFKPLAKAAVPPAPPKAGKSEYPVYVRGEKLTLNQTNKHYYVNADRNQGLKQTYALLKGADKEEGWIYIEYKKDGKSYKRWFECVTNESDSSGTMDNIIVKKLLWQGAEVSSVSLYHIHPPGYVSPVPSISDITALSMITSNIRKNMGYSGQLDFRVITSLGEYVLTPKVGHKEYARRINEAGVIAYKRSNSKAAIFPSKIAAEINNPVLNVRFNQHTIDGPPFSYVRAMDGSLWRSRKVDHGGKRTPVEVGFFKDGQWHNMEGYVLFVLTPEDTGGQAYTMGVKPDGTFRKIYVTGKQGPDYGNFKKLSKEEAELVIAGKSLAPPTVKSQPPASVAPTKESIAKERQEKVGDLLKNAEKTAGQLEQGKIIKSARFVRKRITWLKKSIRNNRSDKRFNKRVNALKQSIEKGEVLLKKTEERKQLVEERGRIKKEGLKFAKELKQTGDKELKKIAKKIIRFKLNAKSLPVFKKLLTKGNQKLENWQKSLSHHGRLVYGFRKMKPIPIKKPRLVAYVLSGLTKRNSMSLSGSLTLAVRFKNDRTQVKIVKSTNLKVSHETRDDLVEFDTKQSEELLIAYLERVKMDNSEFFDTAFEIPVDFN